ncbi:MAG: hypothetical protein WAP37_04135, partial [Solirubrobacterales bacterium]
DRGVTPAAGAPAGRSRVPFKTLLVALSLGGLGLLLLRARRTGSGQLPTAPRPAAVADGQRSPKHSGASSADRVLRAVGD